jgi:glycosyltransferase involved in cell wall biosynthesis
MRIAILDEFSPYGVLTEAERQRYRLFADHPHPWVQNLAEALGRLPGNEIHVIAMTSALPEELVREIGGVRYHFVRSTPAPLKLLTLLESNAWKVRRLLWSLRVEVVNAHSLARPGYFAVRSGLPAVFTLHGLNVRKWLQTRPERWLRTKMLLHFEDTCLRRGRNFILVSPALLQERELLPSQAKLWTVENAISPEYFDERRLEAGMDFLFVGTLQPRKAPLDLLKAMTQVAGARGRLVFSVADAPYRAEMEDFVRQNRLSQRVDFVGRLSAKQIAEELARCRALVLTSKLETAPTVIAEAFAVGKPVIATAVNGVPMMVEPERTGLLFQPGDVRTLAAHMRRLLDDPTLAESMGRMGRAVAAKRWAPAVIAAQTMGVYQALLSGQIGA